MYELFLHDDAERDLEDLWRTDPTAAAEIQVLLEQIQADQYLLESLTIHDFGSAHRDRFHVSKWVSQWKQRRDLWRLKLWSLEDQGIRYRIVYAYIPGTRKYYVLGIVHRTFNYDESSPYTKRILDAYRDLPRSRV